MQRFLVSRVACWGPLGALGVLPGVAVPELKQKGSTAYATTVVPGGTAAPESGCPTVNSTVASFLGLKSHR